MTKRIHINLLLFFTFFFQIPIHSIDNNQTTTNYENLLPMVFKPIEPTMASLGRYGSYPVSLFNGLPQISFTLFEIKSGSLTQPIVLSYHGGGIKVSDNASWVGLGWDLSYGPTITRTVRGKPDEEEDLTKVPDQLDIRNQMNVNLNDYNNSYFDALAGGTSYSYLQDEYYFNAFGYSGMYVLNKDEKPMPIPLSPLKFDDDIIGPDGSKCKFIPLDYSTPSKSLRYISSWSVKQITSVNGFDNITYDYQNDGYITNISESYYDGYRKNETLAGGLHVETSRIGLTKSSSIVDVSSMKPSSIYFKNGKVEFVLSDRYDILCNNKPLHSPLRKLDKILVFKQLSNGNYSLVRSIEFYYSYFGTSGDPALIHSDYLRLRLDKVTEKDHLLNQEKLISSFKYFDGLPNKNSFDTDNWGYYNGKKNSTPIPSFSIDYLTITGGNKESDETKMICGTLNEIHHQTGGKTILSWETNDLYTDYVFKGSSNTNSISISNVDITSYPDTHNSSGLPSYDDWPGMGVKSLTNNIDQSVKIAYSIYRQISDLSHNKYDKCTLRIEDATANNTVFETENIFSNDNQLTSTVILKAGHTYYLRIISNCSNIKAYLSLSYISLPAGGKRNYKIGGLRIKSIKNIDLNGSFISEKSYEYKLPTNRLISSGFAKTDFSDIDYSKVRRSYHNEYWPQNCLPLLTEDYLFYSNAISGIYGTPVCYQHVREYDISSSGLYNGYSDYEFSVCEDQLYTKENQISQEWKRGDLLSKNIFQRTSSGNFVIIQNEQSIYSINVKSQLNTRGFIMQRLVDIKQQCPNSSGNVDVTLDLMYEPLNYYYNTGWKQKVSTTTKDYIYTNGSTSTIEKSETFTYTPYSANHNLMPSSVSTKNSNGVNVTTNSLYVNDFPSVSSGFINDLRAAHILNAPIEQWKSADNNIVESKLYTYKTNNEKGLIDIIYQLENSITTSFTPSNSSGGFIKQPYYKPLVTADLYDSGNLLQYHKENDFNISYILGYSDKKVVAEATNATYSQIDYTSFENMGATNEWSCSNYLLQPNDAYSGTNSILPQNSIVTSLKTLPAGTYVVSLASKFLGSTSGVVTLTGFSIEPFWPGIGVWSYGQRTITLTTPQAISINTGSLGNILLDEIRIQPIGSRMTTYTYTPFVGITSQTDPNGFVTKYEYDGFGSLLRIKDNDGKILKEFEYNYAH